MGQYQDISIKDLVDGINERYFLPDIQRDFVWNTDKNKFEDKVYDLFDSIMRGYPVGTLLFWEVNYERLKEDNISVLEFIRKTNTENESVTLDLFKGRNITLILDGQQRMTILNLAFRGLFEDVSYGKKKKKQLYFNLLSNNDKNKEINERHYEFKLIESEEPYFKDREEKLWHKVALLLKQPDSLTDYWEEITIKNKIEGKDKNRILDNLNRFWKIISEKNISYYEIGKDKRDEEALEIFVRVNSGGITLTYSDLLFSKIKQYWKGGTRKIDAREEFREFLEEINRRDFEFDNDFILKTSLVLIDKDIKYQIKNFNQINVDLIKEYWEEIKNSIKVVIEFLKLVNITSKKYLRSNNAIIPLVYFVYVNKLKEIDNTSKNYDLMRKYIYSVFLNGVFGGQSDSLLKDSRDVIKENKKKLFPMEEIFKVFLKRNKVIRKGEELKDLLNEVHYSSDRSKIILSIIYGDRVPKDFEEDHMFPHSKIKGKFDKILVDNIANIQAIGPINQIKGDKSFNDWLNEPNRSKDYMEIHLVPRLSSYE
ncbi:DUF262 domain-containing protein, partial [Candidatus Pacearchaeota archaeon]|nr:DUF262 domain-containing protein [Candidatus Pacearchaeota archaeon]